MARQSPVRLSLTALRAAEPRESVQPPTSKKSLNMPGVQGPGWLSSDRAQKGERQETWTVLQMATGGPRSTTGVNAFKRLPERSVANAPEIPERIRGNNSTRP